MKSFSVLLVEDTLTHAELVKMALASLKLSCHVEHVDTGEEAMVFLAKAQQEGCLPDLALLDVYLPVMGGHEVLRRMKSDVELCKVPVVMLTTSESIFDVTESYRAHVNSYLVKPNSFPDFKILLNDIVHYWGGMNRTVKANVQ